MREISHPTNEQHSPITLRLAPISAQGTSVLLRSAQRGLGLTTNGKATISFSSPLTWSEIYLTVTKYNRRPYEATIAMVDGPLQSYVPLSVNQY